MTVQIVKQLSVPQDDYGVKYSMQNKGNKSCYINPIKHFHCSTPIISPIFKRFSRTVFEGSYLIRWIGRVGKKWNKRRFWWWRRCFCMIHKEGKASQKNEIPSEHEWPSDEQKWWIRLRQMNRRENCHHLRSSPLFSPKCFSQWSALMTWITANIGDFLT